MVRLTAVAMASAPSLEQRVAARISALEEAQLLRTLCPPGGIDLSSNDYLGLARDPRLQEGMIQAIRREGCGSTGSRLLRGQRDGFARLERAVGGFKGAQSALFSLFRDFVDY